MRAFKRAGGFTLIEMMVTIAVAAILIAWSVPSLNNLMLGNRLTAKTNELVASLQFARSEAIKQGRVIYVSAANAPSNCAPTCEWKDGWRVWRDNDSPANGRDADGSEDLRVVSGVAGADNSTFSTDVPTLTFVPNGMLLSTLGNKKFLFSASDMNAGQNERAVCLLMSGGIATKAGRTSDTNDNKCSWE